ncbi:MAG: pyridine nucleotide-disulfide oxidoreductase [Castellaniella sp.]|uniref:FAD-dependent oxidoreductase n=1 Tax=Castellaniella sp. TaxID=1955812 RepID=UPI00121E57A6|nr:FAD-dependent oxidoreductase [Castellaniella sp.]TAN29618.1 MAG: pyridine nucleotide-disulfide oxidoreductase [Castellaniella sp.]
MKRLVLAGGGHAHLSVLRALAQMPPTDIEVVLITPSLFQNYSGMLPGWISGHYTQAQCRIDLRALAQSARARIVIGRIVGMDAGRHCVRLTGERHINYDVLSMDIGSEIDVSWLEMAGERLLPVRPLDKFFDAWPRILSAAQNKSGYRLAVVGGGAAGVELALAAQYALVQSEANGHIDLVASEPGPLVGYAASVQRRVAQSLSRARIAVHRLRGAGTADGILLSDGTQLPADCIIAATGARAPCWLTLSGLTLGENGYIAVDGHYRSISHPDVFAAGDICTRQDTIVARSGVHAVHAGPVLAANLLASLRGGQMRVYRPRSRSLYLLACGRRYAVASWGGWSAEGEWLWHLKDRIDRRFIRRFSNPKQQHATLSEKESNSGKNI